MTSNTQAFINPPEYKFPYPYLSKWSQHVQHLTNTELDLILTTWSDNFLPNCFSSLHLSGGLNNFFFSKSPPQTWNLTSSCSSVKSLQGLNNLQMSILYSAHSRILNKPSNCFKLSCKAMSKKSCFFSS